MRPAWIVAAALAGCGSPEAKPRDAAAVAAARDDGRAASDARAPDPRAYKVALRRGWQAARAGDDRAALAAFQDALAAAPDDERALVELSWEAVVTGDAGLATRMAERALAVGTTPKLRAMAFYNHGRAAEATGDLARARGDYQQSLALRPNRTVERRLARLAAAGADAGPQPAGSAAPPTLAGPFKDLAGFCADLGLPVTDSGDTGDDPTLEDDVWCATDGEAVTAPAPFDRAVRLRHSDGGGEVSTDLALHAAAGWWVAADVGAATPADCTIKKSAARCSFR